MSRIEDQGDQLDPYEPHDEHRDQVGSIAGQLAALKPFVCHDESGTKTFEMWRDGDDFEVWVYDEVGRGEGMTISAADVKALELWIEPRTEPPGKRGHEDPNDVIVADQERGM